MNNELFNEILDLGFELKHGEMDYPTFCDKVLEITLKFESNED